MREVMRSAGLGAVVPAVRRRRRRRPRELLDGLGGLGLAHEHVREAGRSAGRAGRPCVCGLRRSASTSSTLRPETRERQRDVHRGERLALAGCRGGDHQDARAGVGPGVVEGRADDAVALVEVALGPGLAEEGRRLVSPPTARE